mmetsp:Transcript_42296/g.63942  ORF Transcript_42296/g.63942 Transcript_42296/m.63942 type:complete len:493 (-) Transcript_42296:749-2227(-)
MTMEVMMVIVDVNPAVLRLLRLVLRRAVGPIEECALEGVTSTFATSDGILGAVALRAEVEVLSLLVSEAEANQGLGIATVALHVTVDHALTPRWVKGGHGGEELLQLVLAQGKELLHEGDLSLERELRQRGQQRGDGSGHGRGARKCFLKNQAALFHLRSLGSQRRQDLKEGLHDFPMLGGNVVHSVDMPIHVLQEARGKVDDETTEGLGRQQVVVLELDQGSQEEPRSAGLMAIASIGASKASLPETMTFPKSFAALPTFPVLCRGFLLVHLVVLLIIVPPAFALSATLALALALAPSLGHHATVEVKGLASERVLCTLAVADSAFLQVALGTEVKVLDGLADVAGARQGKLASIAEDACMLRRHIRPGRPSCIPLLEVLLENRQGEGSKLPNAGGFLGKWKFLGAQENVQDSWGGSGVPVGGWRSSSVRQARHQVVQCRDCSGKSLEELQEIIHRLGLAVEPVLKEVGLLDQMGGEGWKQVQEHARQTLL